MDKLSPKFRVKPKISDRLSLRNLSKFYLKSELSGGIVALYSNRLIQRVAGSLLGLFLPIFLFHQFGSINLVLLWYLVGHLIYIFTAAFGAIIASKISFRHALIFSVVCGTSYYVCLYFFDRGILLFSILAIILLSLDRMFYWVPYHSAFAKFTNRRNRGRTIALFTSVASLIAVVLPVISGYIITQHGFNVLFLIVILFYVCSIIPFFVTPRINEYYTFGYWQTWKVLFHPRERRMLVTYMADGAENVIGVVIWPIFMWQILIGNYQAVGLVSSLIILVTVLLRLMMGNYADKLNKKKLLRYGSILYSAGWLLKIFVQTGFHIFIASAYHNFAAIAMRTPYDTLMYEKAADSGHYVDEYSVLREMSLNIGRVLMILGLLVLFNFFGLNYAFIFAAVAVLFMNLI